MPDYIICCTYSFANGNLIGFLTDEYNMFNLYIALCSVIKTLLSFNRQIEEQQMEVEIDNIAAYVFFSQLNTLPTL